jgi:hypothetical protein
MYAFIISACKPCEEYVRKKRGPTQMGVGIFFHVEISVLVQDLDLRV